MTRWLLSIIELASLWIAVLTIASLLSAICYAAFRRLSRKCRPEASSRLLLAYGVLPPIVAGAVLFVLMHPALSGMLVPPHCHGGACHSHVPVVTVASPGGLLFVAGGAAVFVLGVLACLFGLHGGRRWLRTLTAFSRPPREAHCRVIESPERLAWCCGLVRPTIFVSRGLLESLSPAEVAAVLAHEQAHASRRDNLRSFALYWATMLWPRGAKRRVRLDMSDAAELACDSAAARTGGKDLITSAIETLQAGYAPRTSVRQAAFGASNAAERVLALAGGDTHPMNDRHAWIALAVLWVAQVTTITGASHYFVEWVVKLGI